jgi:sugar phosphate isomerase/epimerase
MSLSSLPLSYCTNVHSGRSFAEVKDGLEQFTAPVRENYGEALAAGLWLGQSVVQEFLDSPDRIAQLANLLAENDLICYTLNAFPFGDFHSPRVKENVYLPDWSQPQRLDYTENCAKILAALLPDETEGSISTVPIGFKEFEHPEEFLDRSIRQLIELARRLDRLYEETGKFIRLAIEPEPFCIIETTDEAIRFFDRLRQTADDENLRQPADRYLGLCYDVCHQAVEFEDVAESIRSLDQAGIRINKVHITCALQLDQPAQNAEGRRALAQYVEPRYLHQTMAKSTTGRILRAVDLTEELALHPEADFQDAEMWRIHFHVPVNAEQLGPLKTTRSELKQALNTVAELDYAPHLEVETYTWEVLPGEQSIPLVTGLTRELTATRTLVTEIQHKL